MPGKPTPLIIQSDLVKMYWKECEGNVDCYRIRYRRKRGQDNWKFVKTDCDQNQITITGLNSDTIYVFQVQGILENNEGSYGPANEDIKTAESLATKLLKYSIRISNGNPSKYQLITQELETSRNFSAKTRKLLLGNQEQITGEERTIMLVGESGSGKSTMVDGIINHVIGVSFDDPFRFTIVHPQEEEKKANNQASSQTEWITVYKISPQKGSRFNYTLNIIDIPGFTREIAKNQRTIEQIRLLLSSEENKGVFFIDAFCFVLKASDTQLSIFQKYILDTIMAILGKNIESNICTFFTFADGIELPVLDSLKDIDFLPGQTYQFNNCALFADNKNLSSTSLFPIFWNIGCNSFLSFFNQLCHFENRNLSLTRDVLYEREELNNVIEKLIPLVNSGSSKLFQLELELRILERRESLENDWDFEYEVEETKQIMTELPQGKYVTNCLICHFTCHENCDYADDDEKQKCSAMFNGYCKVCPNKCRWSDHKNTRWVYKYVTEKVKKTYAQTKTQYKKALGSVTENETHSKIKELTLEVDNLNKDIEIRFEELQLCKHRLEKIALRPKSLITEDDVYLMKNIEETEKKTDYQNRLEMLNKLMNIVSVDGKIKRFVCEFGETKKKMTFL